MVVARVEKQAIVVARIEKCLYAGQRPYAVSDSHARRRSRHHGRVISCAIFPRICKAAQRKREAWMFIEDGLRHKNQVPNLENPSDIACFGQKRCVLPRGQFDVCVSNLRAMIAKKEAAYRAPFGRYYAAAEREFC